MRLWPLDQTQKYTYQASIEKAASIQLQYCGHDDFLYGMSTAIVCDKTASIRVVR